MAEFGSNSVPTEAQTRQWRGLDLRFAAPMCFVSLTSLMAFAVLLHFHEREEYQIVWFASLGALALLWPLNVLELFLSWRVGSSRIRERAWSCVLPPLRLVARDHETGQRIWIPGMSWQTVSKELRERLEKISNLPMIIVACLVLPLIGIEHHYADKIEADFHWASCIAAATSLIWFTFTLEFVVMCSLADRKLVYVRTHWLDLAVILLPLVAFLRALRLGRLLRLQQLSKTARMYRMRGVLMRTWRALLVLDIVRRLLQGGPEKRLKKLEELIQAKELELAELRIEQQRLQDQLTPAAELFEAKLAA
jgi:voltage-gated potassium channel